MSCKSIKNAAHLTAGLLQTKKRIFVGCVNAYVSICYGGSKIFDKFFKKALDEKSILSKLSLLVSGNRADGWMRKVMTSRETQ